MNLKMKTLEMAVIASLALSCASAHANTLILDGTIYKQSGGTTFDTWKFNVLTPANFTVDLRAYEASQSNTATAGYYSLDINGDGELTWLDPDTYFYANTGAPLAATDAIVRCDDTANNCPVYQNGLTAATSPVVVTTHQQSETSVDGSIHFRRDPWFDVSLPSGNYLYLVADYRLDSSEAAGGINAGDTFSAPTSFVDPILDHADYRITLSSEAVDFSLSGDTITVSAVPIPAAMWSFGSAFAVLAGLFRRDKQGAKV